MAIRQSIYDWVAVVMMLLSSEFVLGQVRPIEIAPPEKAPIDLGIPAEMSSPAPTSDGMPMGMDGFGMRGSGMGGPGYSATWYPTRPVTNGPIEIGPCREDPGKEECRIDGRQFALPGTPSGRHVEKVIVEALVTCAVGLRPLRAGPEKS